MQNRLIAGLMAVLILSSFTVTFDENTEDLQLESVNSEHAARDTSAEIKIHRPGESIDSRETLTWSPNNITESATIQFTVLVYEQTHTDNIEQINIVGSWIGNNGQFYEQFRLEIIQVYAQEIDGISTITENYTYPNSVWGGDYSLSVSIVFEEAEPLSFERNDLKFETYGYQFGHADQKAESYVCSCEQNTISLKLINTGEDESSLSYRLNLNQTSSNTKYEWDADSTEITNGVFVAGESVTLSVKLQIFSSYKYEFIEIPVYLQVFYENDDGELIFLSDENVYINNTILPSQAPPVVKVSLSNSGLEIPTSDDIPPSDTTPRNNSVFTFDDDNLLLSINISNTGFYQKSLEIIPLNPALTYGVIYSGGSYTIASFENFIGELSYLDYIQFDLLISNFGEYQHETIPLEFGFNDTPTTLVSLEVAPIPIVSEPVISVIPSFSESLALPVDEIEEIQIDLSPYQIFSFFENSWLMECSQPPQTKITIITFETVCDESAIMINHDNDSQLISNLKIQIEVYESFQGDLASVQFRLTPLVNGSNTSILHSLTLDIAIESTADGPNDDDTIDDNDGSNTNSTDGANNTTEDENNSTIDANTDTDGDGVIDTLDACPNTASSITVDEFGCQVIEQDIDDGGDDTAANLTDTEGNSEQKTDDIATQTDQNNVVNYLIIGSIAMAIVGALLFLNSRRSANQTEPSTKTDQPIMPLPTLPLPSMEPVVLQQWTDAHGYSWRQMSDQSIMWWNGSDWIPYGKN